MRSNCIITLEDLWGDNIRVLSEAECEVGFVELIIVINAIIVAKQNLRVMVFVLTYC